jgi:uncharacterized ferritin-like protein (DUF455 family)
MTRQSRTKATLLASIILLQFCFALQPSLPRRNIGLQASTAVEPEQLFDPQTVSNRVFAKDKRPIILFDGVCNLCNNAVNLALDWDPKGKLRFSALQSNVG